jgi:hypothetical protein
MPQELLGADGVDAEGCGVEEGLPDLAAEVVNTMKNMLERE